MCHFSILIVLLLPIACSSGPSAPETRQWSRDDLLGSWTGRLAGITLVPDSTIPRWEEYRDNPLYNQRYHFTDLEVTVNVVESSFLMHLAFHSDSLVFMYAERGRWELAGGSPKQLSMDSTSVAGRLETWDGGLIWEKSECCWRARLELQPGDFSNSGFDSGVLKISGIRSRLNIADLVLEKQSDSPGLP